MKAKFKGARRVMFVCHGNICRSPMAEAIFTSKLRSRGALGSFTVASSATSTEEIIHGVGNPIYPPAARELLKNGITPPHRRAVQLRREDYDKYDLFLAMDDKNIRGILQIFDSDPEGKVMKLMELVGGGSVRDPWYTGRFDESYRDISRATDALLAAVLE